MLKCIKIKNLNDKICEIFKVEKLKFWKNILSYKIVKLWKLNDKIYKKKT